MRIFLGVTDNEWYGHLSDLQPDEVNFWRPSGKVYEENNGADDYNF